MNLVCPNCRTRNVGKIGNQRYYCWECFIEFGVQGDVLNLYEVEEDGSLSSLDDLFTVEERRISHLTY